MLAQDGQGRGCGCVAGYHQHFRPVIRQRLGGPQGIANDGVAALGAVRQPGRIAQIDQILGGQARGQGLEHGKAAHA